MLPSLSNSFNKTKDRNSLLDDMITIYDVPSKLLILIKFCYKSFEVGGMYFNVLPRPLTHHHGRDYDDAGAICI